MAKKDASGVGYSGTPLAKKLGMKEGARVLVSVRAGVESGVEGAEEFPGVFEPLPAGVRVVVARKVSEMGRGVGRGEFGVIVALVTRAVELAEVFERHEKRMTKAGGLWIGWPKKEFRADVELTEDAIRAVGLRAAGGTLVDNKVCAMTGRWSGLRFVRRVAARE